MLVDAPYIHSRAGGANED